MLASQPSLSGLHVRIVDLHRLEKSLHSVKRVAQMVQKRSKQDAPAAALDIKVGQPGQIGRTNRAKRAVKPAKPTRAVYVPDDQKDSLSAGEAARELGISPRSLRRLCSTGQFPSFRTPGGQVRVWRKHLEAYMRGSEPSVPSPPSRLDSKREELQSLNLELQERRLRRDLKKLEEEDAETERKRAAIATAEELRSRAAIEESRSRREEWEEGRLEEERQREADEEWRRWTDAWLEYGLKSLPASLPREFVLQVQPAIEEVLGTVGPTRPRAIVEQLVLGAIQRVIDPWKRQQEIEKAVKQAIQELPFEVRTLSDWFPPNEWEARAMAAARNAIAHLAPNVSLAELRAAAVNAGKRIASEYVSEQARKHARARDEQAHQRNASNKSFLVSIGVADVSSYLRKLHLQEEIFDEDLARTSELEQIVRATLEERLSGGEPPQEALRIAREVIDQEFI